jgi:hypothetical protein
LTSKTAVRTKQAQFKTGGKMTKRRLEAHVIKQFGMGLYNFIKQKVEKEDFYDYEIASILNIKPGYFSTLRSSLGIKRANGFSRRFERTYGLESIERFKKLIEYPKSTLSDVERHFGFSREYARQVYQKIYGYPYTDTWRKKRLKMKNISTNRTTRIKSKNQYAIIKVQEKIEAMGLSSHIVKKENRYVIHANGFKVVLKRSSKPVLMNNKQYFRFNRVEYANMDCDFFICLCKNKQNDTYYIIPNNFMPRRAVSLLPQAGTNESKYAQYKEAWHLLKHENTKRLAS